MKDTPLNFPSYSWRCDAQSPRKHRPWSGSFMLSMPRHKVKGFFTFANFRATILILCCLIADLFSMREKQPSFLFKLLVFFICLIFVWCNQVKPQVTHNSIVLSLLIRNFKLKLSWQKSNHNRRFPRIKIWRP